MPALTEVFTGFGSVAVLIIVGWLFGRSEIVDKRASFTLNMVVFWIAMPCMLAHTLATADSASIFGSAFGVAALSALGTAAFYRIFVAPMFKQRGAMLWSARCRRVTTTSLISACPSQSQCFTTLPPSSQPLSFRLPSMRPLP
ncbi:AEC family transporter [Corynebacterium sp. HMSC072D01]|uniref:AEC family transporter n=1 Tax=Corynebacterium sp. HMSC072D01 TaxID=1739403 RepID=UPI001FEFCE55|nr:AEC family transporter [Corynebacterium sp. HMSC072D01]